jgi:hypothetical protein
MSGNITAIIEHAEAPRCVLKKGSEKLMIKFA